MQNFVIDFEESSLRASGKRVLLEDDKIYADTVEISSCPKEKKDWRILMDDAEVDTEGVQGRNMIMEIAGVPVFYVPYFFASRNKKKAQRVFIAFGEYQSVTAWPSPHLFIGIWRQLRRHHKSKMGGG